MPTARRKARVTRNPPTMELFRRQEAKTTTATKAAAAPDTSEDIAFIVAAFDPRHGASESSTLLSTSRLLNSPRHDSQTCAHPCFKAACISRGESGTIYVNHAQERRHLREGNHQAAPLRRMQAAALPTRLPHLPTRCGYLTTSIPSLAHKQRLSALKINPPPPPAHLRPLRTYSP